MKNNLPHAYARFLWDFPSMHVLGGFWVFWCFWYVYWILYFFFSFLVYESQSLKLWRLWCDVVIHDTKAELEENRKWSWNNMLLNCVILCIIIYILWPREKEWKEKKRKASFVNCRLRRIMKNLHILLGNDVVVLGF